MDSILLSLLKSLSSSLSIYEFLIVILVIVVSIIATVVFISKRTGTSISDMIRNSAKDPVEEKIDLLSKEVNESVAKYNEHVFSLNTTFSGLEEYFKGVEQLIRKQSSDLYNLKRELTNLVTYLNAEVADLKHHLKLHDNANSSSFDIIKNTLANSENTLKIVTAKLDKIDDYSRAAFPEFKAYQRDLDSSLRQMHTDIAIISNLIKISNTHSATLR